jgi:hypothetical protein
VVAGVAVFVVGIAGRAATGFLRGVDG